MLIAVTLTSSAPTAFSRANFKPSITDTSFPGSLRRVDLKWRTIALIRDGHHVGFAIIMQK